MDPGRALQRLGNLLGVEVVVIVLPAADGVSADAAADEVFAVLKSLHPQNAQDFIVDTQEGLLKRLDGILIVFQLILGGVGGLSLLVGGIGIMNIMLVSVTERTREIGIRKAVGAKRGDILLQFVTESMTVSGVGGLIGVGFGYGVSKLVGIVAGENLPTFVPPWAAFLGFGFAVAIGMFFGIYPAFRAAKLDPIDALRFE
ncbi:MAG: FtsX-like permease family protein [Akkermansiaceae bacterium]|nr:FtsX-like permease family protein [Armatimonadota bacterium]